MNRDEEVSLMKKYFPDTQFQILQGIGHAGLALKEPERFARMIRELDET